jgi:23S rRNA pseudouridine2605 synthase
MGTRINKFVAQATGLSRRRADELVREEKIVLNDRVATLGDNVEPTDIVRLNGQLLSIEDTVTIMLNKPVGYVCSRNGQGSHTVYELLPYKYESLKPVGRLDKDSSGLLLLTNDGNLALSLTHPRYIKDKIYRLKLDKALAIKDRELITDRGVKLKDGLSKLKIKTLDDNLSLEVTMHEGRNRQIRRTFEVLGYKIVSLHRIQIGDYKLGDLGESQFKEVKAR